ncbi:MAG: 4-hydroxy-tetrahydrodipicolinate reductase [Lachnospiraceae bacterium]|nr:4-hydroxy-tetrahydrodipicolinate reductase [Lachnospiraceae bacterium]
MTRIIMSGCHGAMGKTITNIVREDSEADIVAGIDITEGEEKGYPVFSAIGDCDVEADVLIDFSTPKILPEILDYSIKKQVPVVLCTTGYTEEQLAQIEAASEKTAVLKSANMSLGINTLLKLVQDAARVLAEEGFDVEIVEKHHNQKADAPSGTALALADSVNEAMGNQYEYIYDRSQRRERRDKRELGISAVRGGTIVGDHDVIFAGTDEVVTLSHRAYSKAVFGKGAVSAAKFLKGKTAGRYEMADVIAANGGNA